MARFVPNADEEVLTSSGAEKNCEDKDVALSREFTDETNDFTRSDSTNDTQSEHSWVDKSQLEPDLHGTVSINIMVGRVNTKNRKSFELSKKSSIHHLVEKIRREFKQQQDDEILVYEPRTDGNISAPLKWSTQLGQYDNQELVFYVEGTPLSNKTTAALESEICRQNIACLGAPGHGKSSFINTVLRALGKQPSAPTYTGTVSGTKVYSPYQISIQNATFTLWDVPGTAVKICQGQKLKQTIENILKGKQDPNEPIGIHSKWLTHKGPNIHGVLAIQNGQSVTEKLHTVITQAACESGRAIPVYVIMTHIDKMDPENIKPKQKEISVSLGIDPSNVLPIANYDHDGDTSKHGEDPQRDFHVRKFLLKVLGASKSYMDNLVVSQSDPTSKDTERPHSVKSSYATARSSQVNVETSSVGKPTPCTPTKKETKESRSEWQCTVI